MPSEQSQTGCRLCDRIYWYMTDCVTPWKMLYRQNTDQGLSGTGNNRGLATNGLEGLGSRNVLGLDRGWTM